LQLKKLYILFLFNLLLVETIRPQTPAFNFQKLGSEEGLNNANIFNVDQSPNGLIYLTTQNGIYYYDGYVFNKLQIDSLKSNALLNVLVKNRESLYISVNNEGIADYQIKTRQFTIDPRLKFLNKADNFIFTSNHAYLLTTGIDLKILDLNTGSLISDERRTKDIYNVAYCLYKTSTGRILLGRKDGLYELEGAVQKKIAFLKNIPIHSITQSSEGKLLLGSSGKILIVNDNEIEKEITPNFKTKSSTFLQDGGKSIDKIIADTYGRIWFTTDPGQSLYLFQNNVLHDIFETLDISPSLINCIYKDRDQNIWVGTQNDGLYYIQNPHFNAINFSYNGKILNVNNIYLKNNLLIAGTANGLFGLNLFSNQAKVLSKPDPDIPEPIGAINEIDNVIYYAKKNEFDLSPSVFMDTKYTYRFKPIVASQFYPLNNKEVVVAGQLANVLLYGTSFSKPKDTLISFPDYKIIVNAFLRHKDSLLVATNNGLFVYSFKSKKYQRLEGAELNYKINDLAFIDTKLYAGHEAGITNVTDRKLIQQLGNLRLNSVKKIKQFKDKIWLATLDGVFICDQNLLPLKVINKTSGLPSSSITDIVFNNETACISTLRGVVISDIQKLLTEDTKLAAVTINKIEVKGEEIVFDGQNISLDSDQENLTIYFYSPLFNKPNRQYYRFKYDDNDWTALTENSLSRDITSGGKHVLEISVSQDNITWSDSTTINIVKAEKLSESPWLYWIVTLSALTLIIGISSLLIKRVKTNAKRRLSEEQQVNLLKHQAMNALLSPHFIFNSLTSIQNYINTNNGLKASEYLAKFSRLIRMIIEKASQSEILLRDELARLNYYLELEKERFKNKFEYRVSVDQDLDLDAVKLPNMIIQPHVENCIIHGILPKLEPGILKISFKKTKENKLLISIEDDGIGLIKAREHAKTGHKSLGTSTIKNILEINSKLTGKKQSVSMVDKSTMSPAGEGTLITIEIEL
jgi:ligand-binding sensor domain-containing protein